jgi:hypothetical protein
MGRARRGEVRRPRDTQNQPMALAGFLLVLAGWFGMFLRVRRDQPNHPRSAYSTYVGPRVFGFKFGRSGFGLLPFYWRRYGLDTWLAITVVGMGLVIAAIIL